MNILEKEIEDVVFQSDNQLLLNKGLLLRGTKFRQVNLGSYGIADIVCVNIKWCEGYWGIQIQIVELKKELIDVNSLMQATRYEKGIRLLISKAFNLNTCIEFSLVLIGKAIQTNGDFVHLLDTMDNVSAYTYHINLMEGMAFNRKRGYTITDAMLGCPTKDQIYTLKKMAKYALKNPELPF